MTQFSFLTAQKWLKTSIIFNETWNLWFWFKKIKSMFSLQNPTPETSMTQHSGTDRMSAVQEKS